MKRKAVLTRAAALALCAAIAAVPLAAQEAGTEAEEDAFVEAGGEEFAESAEPDAGEPEDEAALAETGAEEAAVADAAEDTSESPSPTTEKKTGSFFDNASIYLTVEGAVYPKNEHLTTSAGYDENHYSNITGIFNGLEGRITPHFDYTIATPLGDSWLVSGANVTLGSYLQLTPVSINPGLSATFTPLPFLVFSAGGEAGTGWDLGTLFTGGLGKYDAATNSYTATPFSQWLLKAWAQATFQFDTGALFPGDWTHVLLLFSYQVYVKNYTGAAAQELWTWNCGGNNVNGVYEYMQGILAYQLPIPALKRVGVMFESDGAYSDDVYANAAYNGSFRELSFSPLMQFQFGEKQSLSVLFHFKSRRTFETYPLDAEGKLTVPEAALTTVGREWFFNRLAFSYTYNF